MKLWTGFIWLTIGPNGWPFKTTVYVIVSGRARNFSAGWEFCSLELVWDQIGSRSPSFTVCVTADSAFAFPYSFMEFIVLNRWQYFCWHCNKISIFNYFTSLAARINLQNLPRHMNSWRAAYWIRVNLSLPPSLPPLLILWSPAAQRVDMVYHWGWKWWMCSVPLAESCFMSKNRSYFIAKHSNYSTHISGGLVLFKESNLKVILRISWVVVLK